MRLGKADEPGRFAKNLTYAYIANLDQSNAFIYIVHVENPVPISQRPKLAQPDSSPAAGKSGLGVLAFEITSYQHFTYSHEWNGLGSIQHK